VAGLGRGVAESHVCRAQPQYGRRGDRRPYHQAMCRICQSVGVRWALYAEPLCAKGNQPQGIRARPIRSNRPGKRLLSCEVCKCRRPGSWRLGRQRGVDSTKVEGGRHCETTPTQHLLPWADSIRKPTSPAVPPKDNRTAGVAVATLSPEAARVLALEAKEEQ